MPSGPAVNMAIAENPSLMMRLWEVLVKVFSRLVTDRLTSARDGQTDGTLSKSPLEETTGSYKRSTPGSDPPLYVFPAAAHSAACATGDLPVQDHSFKIPPFKGHWLSSCFCGRTAAMGKCPPSSWWRQNSRLLTKSSFITCPFFPSRRDIPASSYMMHSLHCARNIALCTVCDEPVPRAELEQHKQEFHSSKQCPDCGEMVEVSKMEEHKTSLCQRRVEICPFCALNSISVDSGSVDMSICHILIVCKNFGHNWGCVLG